MTNDYVSVLVLLPFWRYAVGPPSQNVPAMPFYRLKSAMAFADEVQRELPFSRVVLYKRRGFSGIETIDMPGDFSA